MNHVRRLKVLGLAGLAVLAFAAVAASPAQAALVELHSEASPLSLSGGQKTEHVFTINAGTVKCKKATFTGTVEKTPVKTITITPEYKECTAFGVVGATVNVNGCTYVFAQPETTGTPGTFTGKVGVKCPAGKKITVTATGTCTAEVGEANNGALGTVTFKNQGTGSGRNILVTANITGISYSQSGLVCVNESNNNGTYTGSTEEIGTDELGGANGIWLE